MGEYEVENYACPRCGSTNLISVHEPFCSHGRVNCKDCGAKTMRWERLITREAGAKLREQIKKNTITTRKEQSTLLYLETCIVDGYGRVEGRRMNKDDMDNIKKFLELEIVTEFGRLPMKLVDKLRGHKSVPTHYVRFSDKGWDLAHKFRRERGKRIISSLKGKK